MKKSALTIAMAAALGWQGSAYASVEITGLVEIEASDEGIAIATVEVGMTAEVNDKVTAELVFLHEEDGEAPSMDVDTATVSIATAENSGITVGQMVVPFGVYETNMISDPLTLEMAETGANALQFDYSSGNLGTFAYAFNGAHGDDEFDNFGLNLAYATDNINLGLGYIANIGDSDTLAGIYVDTVAGMSVSAAVASGPFTIISEYIAATDSFENGDEPKAWTAELAYALDSATVAFGVQGSEEAAGLDLPEQRTLAAISMAVMESTAVALEWASDEDYAGEPSDTITAQLAIEF